MLGTNKTCSTQRIVSGAYAVNISSLKIRYEPLERATKNQATTKATHLLFKTFCDQADIKAGDRIVVDSRTFVNIINKKYDDSLGKHLEFIMREVNSNLHETIVLKKLSPIQTQYDIILSEYNVGGKDYTDTSLQVLVDTPESGGKNQKILNQTGKFENIDYVITFDLPLSITTDDRIYYQNELFIIDWIDEYLFEVVVGVHRDYDNVST